MMLSFVFALLVSLGQTSATSLNSAAKASGKIYFGSATDNPELTDADYVNILKNNFGQLTPGNSMKWDAIEPQQNVFDFSGGDAIVSLARSSGMIVRGHNLLWYSQLPGWVTGTKWSTADLTRVIKNHVTKEVSHYAGKVYAWDAINEPFNDDGTYRTDVFYSTLGKSYINTALQAAREADPNAKLYINEFNIEQSGPKFDAMVTLVKDLLAAGVSVDGIGFQCHLILGQVPTTQLQANMEAITALGLEVAVTELDIRIELPASDADLEQQKTDYGSVTGVCKAVRGCVGVTLWDFTDKYSWVPSTFSGYGDACAWDANLVPKLAYNGILEGFSS